MIISRRLVWPELFEQWNKKETHDQAIQTQLTKKGKEESSFLLSKKKPENQEKTNVKKEMRASGGDRQNSSDAMTGNERRQE